MRATSQHHYFGSHIVAWVAVLGFAACASAQDRGTLVIHTWPDSAMVLLDGSKDVERQPTPFTNESMIPGVHTVLLRPADPAYKPAIYQVNIEAGQTSVLDHTFEYRTKGFRMEHLSIAPWKFEVEMGIEGRRYIGRESTKSLDSAKKVALPNFYEPDSIPNSIYIPTTFRLGFPGGFEVHFALPYGSYAKPGITSKEVEGFNLSDPGFGLKWIYTPMNSGLDVSWTFGSSRQRNLGAGADALTFTAITNQKWKIVDVAANLGASIRMSRIRDPNIEVGNQIFGKVRGGLLVADRFMPLVLGSAQITLADTRGGKDKDATGKPFPNTNPLSYQVTVAPGAIWYAGQDVSMELGIPLTLLASNAETSWGVNLSLAWDFGLGSKASVAAENKGVALSAYPLQPVGVPGASPTNILFDSKEVSNSEYKEFCDKTGREYPADPEFSGMPGYFTDPKTGSYPVVKISIDDARAYATWIGKRLPTVTEWRKEIESATLTGNMLACGLESPEPVGSRHQGSGLYSFVGNVAEWVDNDRHVGSVAYIAGGFFTLPRERCLDKSRWVDVASPAGAKYIGFRLVTEVK